MKFSKDNTSLVFRYSGDDPLMELTLVEESMIATINPVVMIQRLETRDGKLIITVQKCYSKYFI